MPLPYENIRIVDFTIIEQGPVGTQVLADFGADVIKIEKIDGGDSTRAGKRNVVNGLNTAFAALNRNKKSLTVDLKAEEGKRLVYDLVAVSDVVVSNFRPGVMERLGFGYDDLSAINPRIIVAYASGYGQTGPYGQRQGQDLAAQSISGLVAMSGYRDMPAAAGYYVCDFIGGMLLAQGIMAALAARSITGRGQVVDSCLLNSGLVAGILEATAYLNTGYEYPRPERGFAHPPGNALYSLYEDMEGKWVSVIGSFVPDGWRKTCRALNLGTQAADDPRFQSAEGQQKNRVEMQAMVRSAISAMTREEVIRRLDKEGMLAAPINSYAEAFSDPQVLHNEMVVEVKHSQVPNLKLVGFPVKLSETPAIVRTPPPLLGEHNRQILETTLGYSSERIDELLRVGVIGEIPEPSTVAEPVAKTAHSLW